MSEQPNIHNVVVIGAGPAGYTAALYAGRANLEPIVLAGDQPGGQLMITTDIENYPGFPAGITGPQLMEQFREQAERFGAKVVYQSVTSVDFSADPLRVCTPDQEFLARSVIVATGASAQWLGLPSEATYNGFGVSACATCDGFFFRGKTVAVVGGGDTAMEEAGYLTRHCAKVYVIHRRNELRASKIMQERVLANPKIQMVWNAVVDEILGSTEPAKKVTGVRLKDAVTGDLSELELDGVFVAIGHKPNSEVFKGALDMTESGYLKVAPYRTATNVPGVFAAGDVADSWYRQAVSAAGTGCMAAIDAERYLEATGR